MRASESGLTDVLIIIRNKFANETEVHVGLWILYCKRDASHAQISNAASQNSQKRTLQNFDDEFLTLVSRDLHCWHHFYGRENGRIELVFRQK